MLAGLLLATLLLLPAPAAHAQGAQERQAAAEAFDRGTSAYLAEDFATAARWFEMANNLAPAAPALLQAMRAHARAGNELRAGTLALRLVARFPDAGDAVAEAQELIDATRERFFLVEVLCEGGECAVELDGTLQSHPSFFLEPGAEHTIGAGFSTGSVSESLVGDAGEQRTVRFEAPEGTAADLGGGGGQGGTGAAGPTGVGVGNQSAGSQGRGGEVDDGGLGPGLFIASLALTAGAGAVLLWSGLDVHSIDDEYRASIDAGDYATARQQLDDGQSAETRTNALIGVTAGLAALTVVFAAITDWGGGDEDDPDAAAARRVTPVVGGGPGGGAVGLRGRF
ncbi:MAG: hypothetical protein CMN29_08520 [Sandaracinus sp.]|nr:hypothetical protein [Sandaracinus sp.]HJL33742.1 hypothetical protein [Polyangiaceae bacterium LLY-WYZ-15_(1-7)]